EKGNSGYKAQEFLMYLYGLGLVLFYSKIPGRYWGDHCKLVHGVQVIHQKSIPTTDLVKVHQNLVALTHDFKGMSYQQKYCLHYVLYTCSEIFQI
ncbi:hypothetical protein AN958_08976, partial [Leucoagaricus sp. SymC.cos]